MEKKNPNHKQEEPFKAKEGEETFAYNKDLAKQDANEDFLNLKKNLVFFNKNVRDPETRFVGLSSEVTPEDVKEKGLDFVILADVSGSSYPFRIYLKKSMYFSLFDIEDLVYQIPDITPEDFDKIRFAFISYSDKEEGVKVLDFVPYNKIADLCDKIDEIEIKEETIKARNVFEGLEKLNELSWNEDSIRVLLHYCSDPAYGSKYHVNPKGLPSDYDAYPNGIEGQNEEEILENCSNLNLLIYNFVKFNNRCESFSKAISPSFGKFDQNQPKVDPLK